MAAKTVTARLHMVNFTGEVKGVRGPVVIASDASAVPGTPWIATAYIATTGQYGLHALPSPLYPTGRSDVLVGELRGLARGLRGVWKSRPGATVTLLCDSQQAVGFAQRWATGDLTFPEGYRHARTGQTFDGLSALEWLAQSIAARPSRFHVEWVRGHNGHPLNEAANDFARLASRACRGMVHNEAAKATAHAWAGAVLSQARAQAPMPG